MDGATLVLRAHSQSAQRGRHSLGTAVEDIYIRSAIVEFRPETIVRLPLRHDKGLGAPFAAFPRTGFPPPSRPTLNMHNLSLSIYALNAVALAVFIELASAATAPDQARASILGTWRREGG